jgi:Bacterial Ig-like domain
MLKLGGYLLKRLPLTVLQRILTGFCLLCCCGCGMNGGYGQLSVVSQFPAPDATNVLRFYCPAAGVPANCGGKVEITFNRPVTVVTTNTPGEMTQPQITVQETDTMVQLTTELACVTGAPPNEKACTQASVVDFFTIGAFAGNVTYKVTVTGIVDANGSGSLPGQPISWTFTTGTQLD